MESSMWPPPKSVSPRRQAKRWLQVVPVPVIDIINKHLLRDIPIIQFIPLTVHFADQSNERFTRTHASCLPVEPGCFPFLPLLYQFVG